MEFKLCGSELFGSRKLLPNLFLSSIDPLLADKVSPQTCSCRGSYMHASLLSTAHNAASSFVKEKLMVDVYSFQMNGTNGPSQATHNSRRVLDSMDDEYGGVVVNPERLPSNPSVFASILQSYLSQWKSKRKNGIWLKLPLEKAEFVPIAVKYHHAEKGYVMMTYWIPEGPCMLPENASHQVGVGGFVINERNEVLVVQEKHTAPALAGLWKIPTGFIHESEEIFNGAVREVKEETGIDTEFVEVVAFRHAHNVAFQKSDLFFVCMMRALSNDIVIDNLEVQAAKWMPLVDFVKQPLSRGDRMFKKIIDICIARMGERYCGLSVHPVVSVFDGKLSSLYYNIVDDNDSNCQTSP
ncbi:nudix hydrolase 8-like isoform X2 [Apium graveolens]|uniref:nudix hydrolase 8-like isoform X2 n=1 Tax=Apium graveolens TaxID=4045 RepID=UPI003D7B98FB